MLGGDLLDLNLFVSKCPLCLISSSFSIYLFLILGTRSIFASSMIAYIGGLKDGVFKLGYFNGVLGNSF